MNYETNPIRILLADEERMLRRNLRRLLASERGVRILGEAANSSETLSLIHQLEPDIVLLNFELWRALEAPFLNRIAARVVVIIEAIERTRIIEAFLRGAQAVVLRRAAAGVLIQSFRSVMAGHYWLETETLGVLVEALRELSAKSNGARSSRDFGLTPRELDIVAKIAGGCSNREVSREFSISERTVKHHLTNIFDKVGVSSRLELALFAVNHHLMETGEMSFGAGKSSDSPS